MVNSGFWGKLKKPIMVLAPMADVTDAAFRRIIAKYGKPDVMYTEFVSADGLVMADDEGKAKLKKDLLFSESERPIVAQFFSGKPEMIEKAAQLAVELGFDGIDINMGCPAGPIEKQGAGAALIKNPKRAREIIQAAKRGAGSLPVSVKTRIGWSKNEIETWLPEILAEEPAAVIVHARTRKEMSKVPARWDVVKRAVEIRNELKSETLILGNGDVKDLEDGRAKIKESGVDGAMLGRAIFGNPWLFQERKLEDVPLPERFEVMCEHTETFEKLLGGVKNFALMKKHFKAYVEGFPGAKELRVKLMEADDAVKIKSLLKDFLATSVDNSTR
ncbi:MAG: tRNA-dihydrouridine synthase [Candidatus Pacebacteria bacterium]|nr:tRNA-dihydrouridine synthase [Candidatus Paceibacterota bacterium]